MTAGEWPITMSVVWLTSGGTPVGYTVFGWPAVARLSVDGTPVTDFAWDWPQQAEDIRLNVVPDSWPPPEPSFAHPNGFPWAALPRLNAGYPVATRIRSDTGATVTPTGTAGSATTGEIYAEWTTVGSRAGTTGYFTLSLPNDYDPTAMPSGLFLFGSPYTYQLFPPDVFPPGVDEANPVRFTAKPMASAKGALQTIIDGGGP